MYVYIYNIYICRERGPALDNTAGGVLRAPHVLVYREIYSCGGGRDSRSRQQYHRGGITSPSCSCILSKIDVLTTRYCLLVVSIPSGVLKDGLRYTQVILLDIYS